MSEDYKRTLEAQLWNIANTLRDKMNTGEFRNYAFGFFLKNKKRHIPVVREMTRRK